MDDTDREILALEQRIAAYRQPRLLGATAFLLAVMKDIEELLAGDPIRSKRHNAALRAARDAIAATERDAEPPRAVKPQSPARERYEAAWHQKQELKR